VLTTRTALPVGTGRSVEREREVDLQLQGLVSWGKSWQPAHMAEKRRPPFTDEVGDRWQSGISLGVNNGDKCRQRS